MAQWCQNRCLNKLHMRAKHVLFCALFLVILAPVAHSGDTRIQQKLSLKSLSPYARLMTRNPGNYVPVDELLEAPDQNEIWFETMLVEDSAGVMSRMRADMNYWIETEEFARVWDIDTEQAFEGISMDRKKQLLGQNFLRYVDKRISGEIRSAPKGSALHSVGEVQRALKPNTQVSISSQYKIKFKARLIQGRAYMIFDNPFFDYQSEVSASGRVQMFARREIKSIGVHTRVDYRLDEGVWIASLDRQLTNQISARVSSTQNDHQMAFTDESDNRFELFYSLPF